MLRALWIQAQVLKEWDQFDAALAVIESLKRLDAAPGGEVSHQVGVELERLSLLWALGRWDELRLSAQADALLWLDDLRVDDGSLVSSLWLCRFAINRSACETESALDTRALIRDRLTSPRTSPRMEALEATLQILWRAVLSHDGWGVFDVVAELEVAFAQVGDLAVQLVFAEKLLVVADWLFGYGEFNPGAAEQAVMISRLVKERYVDAVEDSQRRLVALAAWEEYKALGALRRVDEQARAVELMLDLAPLTVELLDARLAVLETTLESADESSRLFHATTALMRGMAVCQLDGRRDEAISLLRAIIERYANDPSDAVQDAVARVRFICSEM